MIGEGRIAIDGKTVETPATLLTSLHGVTVDGRPVQAAAPARLFRFHKPVGLLTAERDPAGRPTIYDRLPSGLPRVIPVGRLDLNTEGLLLLTTDGGLKRQLELPSSGVERSYRARVFGEVSQDQLESLIEGIEIEGVRYGAIDANLERRTGRNAWVEMKLKEGKNREVRRVLEHLGLKVSRLIRTAYGPFVLGDLAPGEVDEVRQHDLVIFRKWLENPSGERLEMFASSRPQRAPSRPASANPRRNRSPTPSVAAARARPGPGAKSTTQRSITGGQAAGSRTGRGRGERPQRPDMKSHDAGRPDSERKERSRPPRPAAKGTLADKRPSRAVDTASGPKDSAPRRRPTLKPGWARPAKPSSRGPRRGPPRS